jgi:hypothetical protein
MAVQTTAAVAVAIERRWQSPLDGKRSTRSRSNFCAAALGYTPAGGMPCRFTPLFIRIHLYEAVSEPLVFYIHSEWVDEAAFDAHPQLPHMTRFLSLARELTTHPVKGIRTKQIG